MDSRLSRPGWYWLSMVRVIASRPGGLYRALCWLAMYALARIVVVRRIVRSLGRTQTQSIAPRAYSIFDADVVTVAESLRLNGFDVQLRLPLCVVQELAFLGEGASASTPYSRRECPSSGAVGRIAEDPTLLELAAIYFGTAPIYQGSRIWWTRPDTLVDARETGARFHYDLYDYRALIFLFYLTDVDPDSGPHVCVRASHRLRRWRDQLHPRRHRSDEEVVRSYGTARIVTICGPAGTVIAEDPFCFHKVKLPVERGRLALQLLYTGNDFPAPSFNPAESSREGG